MSTFTEHDAFREELKTKYMTDVNVLVRAIKNMTMDRAVDILIRSIEKTKDGAEPQDSSVWKVANFILSGGATNIKQRKVLVVAIAKKIKIKDATIRTILGRYDFNLPPHLMPKERYPQREVFDKPTLKMPFTNEMPLLKSVEPAPPKEAPQVFSIEKGGVEEIVIRTSNVEITLKMSR